MPNTRWNFLKAAYCSSTRSRVRCRDYSLRCASAPVTVLSFLIHHDFAFPSHTVCRRVGMEVLKYGGPGPDDEKTTCEDDDWYDEAESEQEELISEEAHQSITHPV